MSLDFFVDLMFIQWESLKEKLHYSPLTVISKNAHDRRGHEPLGESGGMLPREKIKICASKDEHGHAGPNTALFVVYRAGISETGILKN